MTKKKTTAAEYRDTILPGLGKVKVPAHMTDAEVLAEVQAAEAGDAPATRGKKTKPKG